MSSLDPDMEASLRQQLNRNYRAIMRQYANYVDCILTIVEEKSISAERLSAYLLNLCAFKNSREEKMLHDMKIEIEKAGSVVNIFNLLSLKYASFLDYEIFQSILQHYGRNETQEDLNYPTHLEAYIKKHKIREFVEINPKLAKLNDSSKEIYIKFDIKRTNNLDTIKKLREAIANILDIDVATLRLLSIKEGCVLVTFLIPTTVAHIIFSSNTVLSTEQEMKFRAASVLWCECNSYKFDFRVVENEKRLHDSASGK